MIAGATKALALAGALSLALSAFADAQSPPPTAKPPTKPAQSQPPAPAKKPPPAAAPMAPPPAATTPNEPDLAFGAFQRGYYKTAFEEASKRVNTVGDPKAMTLLGELYANGYGVPNDDKKA